jgi:pyridoxine 4-dehydrogenase
MSSFSKPTVSLIQNIASVDKELVIGGDLRVCRLGFGAMRITGRGIWGEPKDPKLVRAVLRRAVELGVNFIDTADSYGPEVSERLIAEALHPYPAGLLVATKGGYLRPGPGRWEPDGRPEHLRTACEGSLRRLRLEQIDLYQLHTVDERIPFEDSLGALAELRQQGKIRHVGLSNVSVDQIERAKKVVPVVSVQNRYSLIDRAAERVLEYCEEKKIAFICWFPLEKGGLSHQTRVLRQVARSRETPPAHIALAWLLHRSPATVPIPGTSSVEHLEENMGSLEVCLTSEQLTALDGYKLNGIDRLRRELRASARRARGLTTRASPC